MKRKLIMAEKKSVRDAGLSTQVHTFNVRGLRNKTKRNRLFSHFKKNMNGIIFLQETHSVPGDHAVWSKEWSGSIYLNSGTSQSRGVAVLIPDKMEHTIQKILQDEYGKYILLEGVFNSYELALCNIYAPTADKQREQLDFLDSILPLINEYADKMILAGDFNTYMSDLDKHGEIKKASEYSSRIKTIIEEVNMCDIYRVLNPEIRRYSWRKMSYLGIQQSRLDYIFIPNSLIYNVLEIEIGHSLYSDHSPIHLKLADKQSVSKGRGFWRLNVSLLKDLEYITQINKIIIEEQEKLRACDKGLAWDTLKMMIRGFSISYASHLAKIKRHTESDLKRN
jgi:exonuclease III